MLTRRDDTDGAETDEAPNPFATLSHGSRPVYLFIYIYMYIYIYIYMLLERYLMCKDETGAVEIEEAAPIPFATLSHGSLPAYQRISLSLYIYTYLYVYTYIICSRAGTMTGPRQTKCSMRSIPLQPYPTAAGRYIYVSLSLSICMCIYIYVYIHIYTYNI